MTALLGRTHFIGLRLSENRDASRQRSERWRRSNRHLRRKTLDEKTIVWIKAGARCAICNRYLLDEDLGAVVPVGENAHIVGQKNTERSPRGQSDLPAVERDKHTNLILLCRERHKLVDSPKGEDLFTVQQLRLIKAEHEARIHRLTGMSRSAKTAVLRLVGTVRGNPCEIGRGTAATAVVASGRYPHYPMAAFGDGVEADLRAFPGEGSERYYQLAQEAIDQAVGKLEEAVAKELIKHVSVFAMARLPLLVYLGFRLDDTWPAEIYQLHRKTEDWVWRSSDQPLTLFEYTSPEAAEEEDAHVLLLNVSGSIEVKDLPSDHQTLPVHRISAAGTPGPDSMLARESLQGFEEQLRKCFAELEKSHPQVKRLYVHGALPVSAAVVLGRCIGPHCPTVHLYEFADGQRRFAMEYSR